MLIKYLCSLEISFSLCSPKIITTLNVGVLLSQQLKHKRKLGSWFRPCEAFLLQGEGGFCEAEDG